MPLVDVLVHNTGTRRTVISEARFVIRGFGRLSDCRPPTVGARLTESARYDVLLPVSPHVGQKVTAPVSQEIGRDQADRFGFRFGTSDSDPDDTGADLYLLDVELLHDNERTPLRLGRILLALPGSPSTDATGSRPGNDPDCVKGNRETLRRLTATHPIGSPEVKQLVDDAG